MIIKATDSATVSKQYHIFHCQVLSLNYTTELHQDLAARRSDVTKKSVTLLTSFENFLKLKLELHYFDLFWICYTTNRQQIEVIQFELNIT